jgi:hypothetical protein
LVSTPKTDPVFTDGLEALVLTFAFLGLRTSLLDFCLSFDMVFASGHIRLAVIAQTDQPPILSLENQSNEL